MQIVINIKNGLPGRPALCKLLLWLVAFTPLISYGQIRMLHSDPEFDEYRIRKHLLIRGFSTDSAEALLNSYKYQYYQNLEIMQSQKTLSGITDDGTAANRICGCYDNTCWTSTGGGIGYLHSDNLSAASSATALGNFFDQSVTGWATKISNAYLPGAYHWLYSATSWDALSISAGTFPSSRYKINENPNEFDPFTNQPVIAKGSLKSVRVGSPDFGIHGEKLATRFTVGSGDQTFDLNYAVVLFDPPTGHDDPSSRPAFSIRVFVNPPDAPAEFYEDCCMKYEVFSSPEIPGFKHSVNDDLVLYKPWSVRSIDLTRYETGSEIIIEVTTHHCAYGPHFSYAYVDGTVNNPKPLTKKGPLCVNSPVTFSAGIFGTFKQERIKWVLTKGASTVETKDTTITYPEYKTIEDIMRSASHTAIKNALTFTRTYSHTQEELPVNYTLTLEVSNAAPDAPDCPAFTFSQNFQITDCQPIKVECEDCIPSFSPVPGKKYVVSAWVKQKSTSLLTTYTGPEIWVRFNGVNTLAGPFKGSGAIIDGWQKIEEVFTVPEETSSLEIELKNASVSDALFDDIRVYPFDGALRSFVYNAGDFKLRAELDENNYATFYDYDEQGNLVRVKKETEKGVQTVKEIFTNTRKAP